MVKNKEDVLLTKLDGIQKRCKEHFLEVLNLLLEENVGVPYPVVAVHPPTKAEIYAALHAMKNGTAGGSS